MSRIVIASTTVVNFPHGGGHFWVYLQYVHALRSLGCDVYWLERLYSTGDKTKDASLVETFRTKLQRWGLEDRVLVYSLNGAGRIEYLTHPSAVAERTLAEADLLLNLDYRISESMLARFRRTALVDIDPGLLQFWMRVGQLRPLKHDIYFTTGETVGKSTLIDDHGIPWIYARPPVCLDLWTYTDDPGRDVFTTVSGWWGGYGKGEWVTDGDRVVYENNKRVSFLEFLHVARATSETIELALALGHGDPEERKYMAPPEWKPKTPCPTDITNYAGDAKDRWILESYGWKVRSAAEAAASPELYQDYVRQSRGEFSCAKPSCMRFQNAWVSDRSLCYLASGKPVVVQYTGQSSFLPNGEGMFRFSSVDEAVEALAAIREDYRRHSRAAREIAETFFDARSAMIRLLEHGLAARAAC
jgi:hypothetical protein